jgi:hypothetical protein
MQAARPGANANFSANGQLEKLSCLKARTEHFEENVPTQPNLPLKAHAWIVNCI